MKDKVIHFQVEDGKMYILYESGKMYMSSVGKSDFQRISVPDMTLPKTP